MIAPVDLEIFFKEQDERMNLSDEDIDEYLSQKGVVGRTRGETHPMTKESVVSHSPPSIDATLDSESPQKKRKIDLHDASVNREIRTLEFQSEMRCDNLIPDLNAHHKEFGSIYQEERLNSAQSNSGYVPQNPIPTSATIITQLNNTTSSHISDSHQAIPLPHNLQDSQQPSSPTGNVEIVSVDPQRIAITLHQNSHPVFIPDVPTHLELAFTSNNPSAKENQVIEGTTEPERRLNSTSSVPSVLPSPSPIEDASELKAWESGPYPQAISTQRDPDSDPIRLFEDGPRVPETRVARQQAIKPQGRVIRLAKRLRPQALASGTRTAVAPLPGKLPDDHVATSPVASSSESRASSPTPVAGPSGLRAKPNGGKHPKESGKMQTKSRVKEKPQPMTPLEYAQKLQQKVLASVDKPKAKWRPFKYLKGKVIFYIGGDMKYAGERTKGRMDYIVKHGGTLQTTYDPTTVTHIVTDAQRIPTLRALGLRSLAHIPQHVPTVTWKWVISGHGRAPKAKGKGTEMQESEDEHEVKMSDPWMHAAFVERFDAGVDQQRSASAVKRGREDSIHFRPRNQNPKSTDKSGNFSHISEFAPDKRDQVSDFANTDTNLRGQMLMSPPLSPKGSSKVTGVSTSNAVTSLPESPKVDPLAEFYAQAKAERDIGLSEGWEEETNDGFEESEDEIVEPSPAPPRRGWTCDRKETQRQTSVNQDIVDKLEELMELHKLKPSEDDRWRAFSYGKALRALRNYPKRIKSFNEARNIRGVGTKTALKIVEILQTGELRRIGYETTADVTASRIFQGVYGVGRSIALQWYASGCRTLEDVKARKGGIKVSAAQEIGIRYYDELNTRMPRSEAEAIFNLIKPIALKLDPDLFIDIMGSFRRGKPDCGDIDILITRPTTDGKTHAGIVSRLLHNLHDAGILTEDLSLPEDMHDLEASYRGICHLPDQSGSIRRRIDILTVPWTSRGAALLYYTGDDIFNRAMRFKANVMGFSLNQKGLFGGVVRDPRDRRVKLNEGTIVASETEEEIFKILGVPWQEPHERVRG